MSNITYTKNSSIGIFDSGLGGLTVTKAVIDLLPNESIVYFGDTAHLPYGDKSAQAIQTYTLKIADMLLNNNCKMLLVACNSISAVAYNALQQHVGKDILLINVIDPTIEYLHSVYKQRNYNNIGLIGTRQTVKSNIYRQKIAKLNSGINFQALATPLLVPIIEEGFINHGLIDLALEEYLSQEILHNIDALILGCTHYPLIKNSILQFYQKYNKNVDIIDSSKIVAQTVKKLLNENHLLNEDQNNQSKKYFYISDYTDGFVKIAQSFFNKEINLEYYPLWN